MTPTVCPKCGAGLTHHSPECNAGQGCDIICRSRVIGIYDREPDRSTRCTTHWRCPDCSHEWPRTTEGA